MAESKEQKNEQQNKFPLIFFLWWVYICIVYFYI